MKQTILVIGVLLMLSGCNEAKEAGDETAREITGANMIEQGRAVQQQLHDIDRQQQQRFEQLEKE